MFIGFSTCSNWRKAQLGQRARFASWLHTVCQGHLRTRVGQHISLSVLGFQNRVLSPIPASATCQNPYVSNIVPQPDSARITLDEANRLEAELVDFLRPLLPATVRIKQSALTKHLRDLLQPATYQ